MAMALSTFIQLNIIIKSFSYFQLFLIPGVGKYNKHISSTLFLYPFTIFTPLLNLLFIQNTIVIMKQLADCKDEIHSCSKCGLCQSVCPIYKITGNDCTVSRGQFIMLQGLIKGDLKMSKTINRYLDLCLKCNACSKFCPSGIDVVDIIALAKAEYFKLHLFEKIKSRILKFFINGINVINRIIPRKKSKTFEKKVIYFGGCGGAHIGSGNSVIKMLNSMNIEVITPDFSCCGFPFFVRGDFDSFKSYIDSFYAVLDKYDTYDIVVNCATCEKTLKSYPKWSNYKEVRIKNVIEYIKDNNLKPELKKKTKVTYHKPCNLDNYEDIKWILDNTKNIEYIEMQDYDKCCGLEGIGNLKERKIMSKLFKAKRNNIIESGSKIVLTSCLACKITLQLFSWGKYKVFDFIEFFAKHI